MRKFKVFIDIDEEEKFLREMAEKGYIFKKYSYFGFYHFEPAKPQTLNYRVDYRMFGIGGNPEFLNYVAMFEDAGWKHVYGTKISGSQYFLPQHDEEVNDIFSDSESKRQRYIRLYQQCIVSLACAIIYFIAVLAINNFNLSSYLFQTPGLWEMGGTKFWRAFWFEFPFMLLRLIPILIFTTGGLCYAIWAIKAKKLFENKY
ncbi:hypothetical protein DP73_03550 [Desulfosporosinus sp. HMP52]|uniref:DUF2812 domain-containing protein n=1 Tax=Desulfosporosinus sp. HMP52 TaxID=1487923 RepID=UPI00051FA4C2|nr:DUF2812 domain-containing protein [Desulfosporosinus sp. HMP52]KGK91492.1 hypothetical protein DP73_03550 [Desulfosporosinus sp. HMP52]